MKRKITLALTAILLSLSSMSAQLLWRVSGPNAKPSYIFGTHHVAPKSLIETTPGLVSAIENADKVYGEIDLTPAAQGELQQLVMATAMAPADSTLSRVISPAALARLDSIMGAMTGGQAGAANLEPLKPALVGSQVAMLQQLKAFPDFNPAEQLDTELQKRFLALGKPTGGLETAAQQIDVLFGAPISIQAADLEKDLAEFDASTEAVPEMAKAYLGGDLEALWKIINDPAIGMDANERKKMLDDRNEAWVKVLTAALPTASLLIVVGAGHLPGERGLINLLRERGYKVEPVTE